MNGTIRTSEPDQALLRPHTSSWQRDRASGPLLPMARDVHCALTNPASNDMPLTALGTWLAVIAVILTAFGVWGAV